MCVWYAFVRVCIRESVRLYMCACVRMCILTITKHRPFIFTFYSVHFDADYSAPVFTNCPPSQVVFAEINQTTASVRWPEPRATDNSNNVLRVVMTAGNGSGVMRPEGTTLEAYEAVDESGNRAECSFNVTVKGNLSFNARTFLSHGTVSKEIGLMISPGTCNFTD